MKQIIMSIALLLVASSLLAMDIGEIARFNNRRPALGRFKVEGADLRDFNRDGVADISVLRDSALHVIDAATTEQLWRFDMTTLGVSWPEARVVGFLSMSGQPVSHAFFYDSTNKYLWLVNVSTGVVDYKEGGNNILATPVAVQERPDNGKHVIVVAVSPPGRIGTDIAVVIVGVTGGSSNLNSMSSAANREIVSTMGAYELELKFQAGPGLRLAYDPDLFDPMHDMDIDGDERMDIPMIIEDPNANNEPIGVAVRSGDNFEVLWQFPFPPEHKDNILKGFHGFADVNADGEKEAIFGKNLAVTLDGAVHTFAENFVTLDVNDVDGDGFEDIIGLNTTDSTVVVYGAMTATSVESYDPADIHFRLFQNYPNPFNPGTTISYSIATPGDVALRIYNSRGELVLTLVQGYRQAGDYSQVWDGRDDGGRQVSSGWYFYRLTIGEALQARAMLLLK